MNVGVLIHSSLQIAYLNEIGRNVLNIFFSVFIV